MSKFKNLSCSLKGHDLILSKKVTAHISEYTCSRCGQQLTNDVNRKLVVLTQNRKEINQVLSKMHITKLSRKKKAN